MDPEVDRLGSGLSASVCTGESDVCILSDLFPGNDPQNSDVWIRSECAFVFQTHFERHRTPLLEDLSKIPLLVPSPSQRKIW